MAEVNVTATLDLESLKAEMRKGSLSLLFQRLRDCLEREAKLRAVVDKGAMRAHIYAEIINDGMGVHLHADEEYSIYVETGTGLYGPKNARITPTTKKVLRWQSGADTFVFASSTAGMHAKPFMAPACEHCVETVLGATISITPADILAGNK